MPVPQLRCHSGFSFLQSTINIQNLVERAASLGFESLALTDDHRLSGAVRFHRQAQTYGIKPIVGATIQLNWNGFGDSADQLTETTDRLVLLAKDPTGYHQLCQLLSRAHLDNPRGEPALTADTLPALPSHHLIAISAGRQGAIARFLLERRYTTARHLTYCSRDLFGENHFYLALEATHLPAEQRLNQRLRQLSRETGVPRTVAHPVRHLRKQDFPTYDLLTCVRRGITVNELDPKRSLNAEQYLKSPDELAHLFAHDPEAIHHAEDIAGRCRPALDLSTHHYPQIETPSGMTAADYLTRLVFKGARRRYGSLTRQIRQRLKHELRLIRKMNMEDYFLLVWDVTRFARNEGIRFAGRGSAADSAVTYCLGITEVDAIDRNLLFERFMSPGRREPPDIDIDFDARYRDRVARYVYETYGENHVAGIATYQTYRARSAIRDLGKALVLPKEAIDRLAKTMPHIPADAVRGALEKLPELQRLELPEDTYRQLWDGCETIAGLPRQLGTHLSGLVISREPLDQLAPLEHAAKGTVITGYDKEDVEDLGLLKLDLLPLRMLSTIEDTVQQVKTIDPGFDETQIPAGDEPAYRRLHQGDTAGAFQLESPAQRQLHGRLQAQNLEDIICSIALIRPGPMKGNMVDPFIARHRGDEPVSYPHPQLEPVLKHTYGIVLFQEQVIEIATVIAGFDPGEADTLRRAMTHSRSQQAMERLRDRFIKKAKHRGVGQAKASEIFEMMAGYASYGFNEAHAAAFGVTAYRSLYLLEHYPAEFYASLLNHQPMGYYPPHTLAVEARRRGLKILPLDIHESQANVETAGPVGRSKWWGRSAIRLSLRQVKGMSQPALETLLKARQKRPFRDLTDFVRRTEVPADVVERLIRAGAFDRIDPHRRRLLWQWLGRRGNHTSGGHVSDRELRGLRDFSALEKSVHELDITGIPTTGHPLAFLRKRLNENGCLTARAIRQQPDGAVIQTAGLVVVPHRPPTRSGRTVVFLSLEDETGLTEVTIFEDVYRKYGHHIFTGSPPPLVIRGRLQRRGKATGLIAKQIEPLDF